MGEVKHLVVAQIKEGVVVEDIVKGIQDLVSEIDSVLSFEWGEDVQGDERKGFTHAFIMTFKNQEDLDGFMSHPKHAELCETFKAVIENNKVVALDFPAVVVKPSPA